MQWLGETWRKLLALVRRRQLDRDLEVEMRFHLDMKARDNRETGMSAEQARYAAQRRFGNATLLKEESREMWGWGSVERLGQDLRYAVRALRKNLASTAVALLTLAIGIAANTVIFTVVHAVLLAPLPYREPDRLAILFGSARGGNRIMMSAPDAADLHDQSALFEDIAVAGYSSADLAGSGEPERVIGGRITANLFSVLGIKPVLGRGFEPLDDRAGAPPVVILSHTLWQRRFGGDPATIGRAAALGKQSRIIVGVMPAGFHFPNEKTEFWYPMGADPVRVMRNARMFRVVGRLKPLANWEQARVEMKTLAAHLESAYPGSNKGWSVEVVPLTESVVGGVRSALFILLGAVGMVLLVACANVANLLLSRGVQRKQEMAVRAALGAGRRRLVRLLFVESLVLAVLGGALGVGVAAWGVHVLAPLYPPTLPRTGEIRLNLPVLAFTTLLSLGTALLIGLLPALRISRTDLNAVLKAGVQSRGLRTGRARGALVVAQVAMAMVLLTCAGLLVRSFLLRTRVSGFDPSNVLTVDLPELPSARLSAVLERVRAIPGVTAAGSGTSFPYSPAMSTEVEIADRTKGTVRAHEYFDIVTPGYFRALRIPLRKGREIDGHDTASAAAVAVINEAMARRYFPGEDPIGKEIRFHQAVRTIVGLVGDSPPFGLDRETQPAMYLPFLQDPSQPNRLAVRTAIPPHDLAASIRATIRELEPKAPIVNMATVEDDLSRMVASPRFYMLLLGLFASLALALAVLGVYGVVSFAVTLRTHEIGVRMALGANGGNLLRAVMWQGTALAAVGAAIGGAAALGATRLLTSTSLLFRVKPTDPLTFVVVPAVLLASALAACWLPARRATKVDPAVALRYE